MSGTKKTGRTFFTYIVRCADGSLYTGYTVDDPDARIAMHNSGKGAKYTRSRRPVTLIWSRQQPSLHEAMSMEYNIKQMTRKEKERLISETARPGDDHE